MTSPFILQFAQRAFIRRYFKWRKQLNRYVLRATGFSCKIARQMMSMVVSVWASAVGHGVI